MATRRILHSKQHRDIVLSALAVFASAATVVTCSAMGTRKPHHGGPPPPVSVEATPIASVPPVVAPPAASQDPKTPPSLVGRWFAPSDLGTTPEGNAVPDLPQFYDALARLETRLRHDHVRVVWLGDSHTQADGWTHAVRKALQARFGNGGPGFVHVGWITYGYRRENVVLRATGSWSLLPNTLVSVTPVDDGVLGLGGLRLEPRGADATASVVVNASDLPGKGAWDLAVRLTEKDASLVVQLDGKEQTLEAQPHTLGHIRHVPLESKGPGGTLQVSRGWNRPQLLGVVVEGADRHGVVLDTLGLNGARYRSALAWDEATWVAELARRQPDLVVLAFGTNESSDVKLKAEAHAARVRELVERIRKAAPQVDCLIFGPIDRGGEQYEQTVVRINEAQASAARELGCAFWNGQQAMGGPGSMQRWASMVPPLGGGDRVHLYPRGYQKLGEMLGRDLLAGYDAGVVRAAPAVGPVTEP
jgi:lysophospholipase L1-like esterase